MKIVVYAISKNESINVLRWYESMKEADDIYVLDTGSTDDTVDKLKNLGVNVSSSIIEPFRFDVARNKSLELVPIDTDICVCTDFDEVFNKGWRSNLEKSWNDANRLYFNNGNKIHDRLNYRWINPVYERLMCLTKNEKISIDKNIILSHYQDSFRNRYYYLSLLELAIDENINRYNNMYLLGREYMFYREWDNAIYWLKKCLKYDNNKCLKSVVCLLLSICFKGRGNIDNSKYWCFKAIDEDNIKDAYILLSIIYYEESKYRESIINIMKSKMIDSNYILSFINDELVNDILSVCFYNVGLKDEAIFYLDKISNPFNIRLVNNREIFSK